MTATDEIVPQLRRSFWLGASALVAVALTYGTLDAISQRSVFWLLHGREVSRIAGDARSVAGDRQRSMRGFLLSGNPSMLQLEIAGRGVLRLKLDSLVSLTADRGTQQDRARMIRDAISRWERGYVVPALANAQSTDLPARSDAEIAGKELFNSIDATFAAFLKAEERLYQRRAAIVRRVDRYTLISILVEIALLLAVLIWLRSRSITQAKRVLDQRRQLEHQTAELRAQAGVLEDQAKRLEEQAEKASSSARSLEVSNNELAATVARLQSAQAEAKQALEAREETLNLLDFVLGSSPVGFALFDLQLRFTRVNPALSMISGIPMEEHFGKTVRDLTTPEIADIVEPILNRVLETGVAVTNVSISGHSAADSTRGYHCLVNFFRVATSLGVPVGVGAVVIETTERRNLEEQLLKAQKMEAIGRLAGGIAHDFNNMLTAIKSYCELLLLDMSEGNQQRDDVQQISRAADRATTLTRQLLAFSRQQVLRPQTLDINAAVIETESMLRRLIGADIELLTRLSPALGMVTADPGEVERVIMNLVLNARDAMPQGGKLTIETANVELDEEYAASHANTTPGPYVMLAVSDTGIGMDKEVTERLFEPFFTTKEKGDGTGLGLSSVYGIVKQSGGNIWVYSERGHGTTFKIYLPRVSKPPLSRRTPASEKTLGGSETILLVEDEEPVRAVAGRILRRWGYTVKEASHGAEALRICEGSDANVDLIVTDLVMPEMGGPELALRVRELRPGVRILFTSGYTEDALVRQSFLDPLAAFIEKPFTPEALARKVREVLDFNVFSSMVA